MNVEEPSFAMQVRNRVERIIRYLSINGFVNKALIRGWASPDISDTWLSLNG
jgi:hypothetical protein